MTRKILTYKKYYDLIATDPGKTLAQYARKTPNRSLKNFSSIVANMEYFGFLLIEGPSGDIWPYKVIRRYPEDLHTDDASRWTKQRHANEWHRACRTDGVHER